MTKKIYLKDESFDPIYKEVSKGFFARTRILPSFFLFGGVLVFISQVVLPLVVFTTQDDTIELVDNATVVGRAAGFSDFEFSELTLPDSNVLSSNVETTNTSQEYIPRKNTKAVLTQTETTPEYFQLSIPKLGIKNALVETESESLNPVHALGHYPGTELPGENGNAFIFGHSVLPWFFNPKNYKTIFSTLPKLEVGDEIIVDINNKTLVYKIESTQELNPKDVRPLANIKPSYLNESTLVLMTCSPPGTKLKRLLVNAVLQN
ncbi:sortase [Patescibacteria group bacterium]